MDKDLKDAVLAAFDSTPDDSKAEDAGPAVETPVEEADEGAGAAAAMAGQAKKKVPAVPGTIRRAGVAGAAPARRAGVPGTDTGPVAAARPKTRVSFSAETGDEARPAARAHPVAVPVAPAAAKSSPVALLSLLLTVVLALLVMALLVQVSGLKRDLQRSQERLKQQLDEQLTDVRNYSRIQFSTYAEQGKRPQQVVAVIDVKDGKPKIVNLVVRPLEEE